MEAVSLGSSGIVFEHRPNGASMHYCVRQKNDTNEVIFTRGDLVHMRDRAAHYDSLAEGDAIYDGPKFSAVRTALPPMLFGVRLVWKEDGRSREFFFQGKEWNAFLKLLDTVCANACVA